MHGYSQEGLATFSQLLRHSWLGKRLENELQCFPCVRLSLLNFGCVKVPSVHQPAAQVISFHSLVHHFPNLIIV